MDNAQIAAVFQDIADLLEIKGENKFKIRAYQRAIQAIESLPQELEQMMADGEDLKEIPGVGDAIAGKISELVQTGKLQYYEDLKAQLPPGITALLEIPGVGPRTAHKLGQIGISNIDQLEKAIQGGSLHEMLRLGDKTLQNILHEIQDIRRKDRRIPIGEALPLVDAIFHALSDIVGVRNLTTAGSLRRFRDTAGDIDLMGTADNAAAVIDAFVALPLVKQVLAQGTTKASVIMKNGLQADLRMVEQNSFGALLQYFTGSKQHNILLRTKAQKRGLSLNEYGITDTTTNMLEKFSTEEDFYHRLGLQYIPPEIREGQGEIELAERNMIPHLVEMRDVKGDLHIHSNWSDGRDSIESLAMSARDMGYEFICITDHSAGLGIAHGLNTERLAAQIEEIKLLNHKLQGMRVLSGIEVDIHADGSLDLPPEILSKLDIVTAAIHSGMREDEEQMTRRVIKALENPLVHVLAHPTCRVIGSREPVALDMEALFRAALQHNKALEINANPSRLDLKDIHIQRARELGVKLTLGTDAHGAEQLRFMRFGVGTARRGWCQGKHLLNSWRLPEILKFLSGRK
ncbi:MAG TPA: DNA polymerase/3'-5' exonuclease PolX [Dehalococcoidia bacterium]|nr:DNA polymerase/3'-5' exonuclease PolX [Dehalococcoidia bacterium]